MPCKAANDAVTTVRSKAQDVSETEGLFTFFDLRNNFFNEWYAFPRSLKSNPSVFVKDGVMSGLAKLDLSGCLNRRPYWTQGMDLKVMVVSLIVQGEGGNANASIVIPVLVE